jgi:uncharacterized protein DUF1801
VLYTPPKELKKFLRPYPTAVQELALQLRQIVLEELGPCHENIYDAYNAVAVGYGPTDRMKDGICHIAVYARHVNLGFNHGTALPDPRGILQGTGKWTRHITLESPADLVRPEIRAFLRAARKHAGPPPQASKSQVISLVKAVYSV